MLFDMSLKYPWLANKSPNNLFKDKRKVNIASIAEILNLPRETVRRKVLHLHKIKLIDYGKNGIGVGADYKVVFNEFVLGTINNMSSLIKKWEADGSLKNLLESRSKSIAFAKFGITKSCFLLKFVINTLAHSDHDLWISNKVPSLSKIIPLIFFVIF